MGRKVVDMVLRRKRHREEGVEHETESESEDSVNVTGAPEESLNGDSSAKKKTETPYRAFGYCR